MSQHAPIVPVQTRQKTARTPASTGGILQRKCACGQHTIAGGECEECRQKREGTLQRAAVNAAPANGVPPIVHDVLSSPGQPLDPGTRAFMEPRFGHDFSKVRVHTDARAAESAQAVNALAYTVGHNVVFGAGQYAPETIRGKGLLAHELTHVVQQQGAYRDSIDKYSIAPVNSNSEKEAEVVADALFRNNNLPLVVHSASPATLSRQLAEAELDVEDDIEQEKEDIDVPEGEKYATPHRRSKLEAMFERVAQQSQREHDIMEAERPVATLDRGGSPPDFITVTNKELGMWSWGNAQYKVRSFHVLDAIEYEVGRANTETDLESIQNTYIGLPLQIDPYGTIIPVWDLRDPNKYLNPNKYLPVWDYARYPKDVDPGGVARTETYNRALEKRIKVVPALAKAGKRSVSKKTSKGCIAEPVTARGGDPLATLFCQIATHGSPEYLVTTPSGEQIVYDALIGKFAIECKCGYASLAKAFAKWSNTNDPRYRWSVKALEDRDKQMLRQRRIATECGLQLVYFVSNDTVKALLESRWFGDPPILIEHMDECG